jgi:hypothetical protein
MGQIVSRLKRRALAVTAGVLLSTAAHADVVISTAATANMACSGSVCAPTAKNAVLNAGDLENMLASGAVEVTTTGSGVQASDIAVKASLTWSNTNTLALDAQETILVDKPISINGQGGLSIATNDGGQNGYFGFQGNGQVTFANLSSALAINGAAYTLVGDIATLATDIAANPGGNYALANDYNASKDGAYQNSVVPTEFFGNFEGLGNAVSNLSLSGTGNTNDYVGLFASLGSDDQATGNIENVHLTQLSVGGSGFVVGGLVGGSAGNIAGATVSGVLTSSFDQNGTAQIGGLAGISDGAITRSSATATIGNDQILVADGGLAAVSFGTISQSYADCSLLGASGSVIGGLVAGNGGSIVQSYAMGSAPDGGESDVGGLVAVNDRESTISQSYSTTALDNIDRGDSTAGGLIGVDYSHKGSNSSDYWDVSTSNITGANQGAGTPNHDRGIEPLTSEELQSGLPKGFDRKVWALNPKINGGFPYLIANPPSKD